MPGFADSFWSGDYAGGLGVLFGKLQQGVIENEQILTIARMRAEAEEQYGRKLGDVTPTTDRMNGGFQRDDGASLRKAYEGVRTEMQEASKNSRKIASNISELVIAPFGRWCDAHEGRVQNSHDDLQARIRTHDKQAEAVRRLRSAYFNKCRQVEDLEEENKLAFPEPEKQAKETSPKGAPTPVIKLPEEGQEAEEPEEENIEIGDEVYPPEQVKKILTDMLNAIPVGETKVPILGTYTNVSTGADITEYVQRKLGATTVSYAERIGQDLVDRGFLRLVGNVGRSFANSSKMHYQWRPRVFQLTGLPPKQRLQRVGSGASETGGPDSPKIGSVGDVLSAWNPLNNAHPNETPMEKLQREAREADERYKAGVRRLDLLRCNLEEAIVDHLRFMERCELDRLRAIKAVLLDFSGAISNVIPSLQSTVDNMMLYQETVQPLGDLRYLLENYRTGAFFPKVTSYDNYYNQVDEQTFGVDLEARARNDRKRVPIIITTILTFLDNHYPDLEGDEARRGIWLVDVPLAATHHLRNQINTGKTVPREILERYEIPIVASVLKLYLLELPDSLVSSQVYEVVKTIYASPDSSESEETRVSVLQNTLGQLRLANIATLDALTTHFTRLIELTSADEAYVAALAQALATCVLRPRAESALTLHERHAYRLVRDLFQHKEAIFGELKRASSLAHGGGGGGSQRSTKSTHHQADATTTSPPPGLRGRAPSSTDEANRRTNMEARQRAIVSRSRAASPANGRAHHAPPLTVHRRDRSVGAAEGRFPVVSSPPADGSRSQQHPRVRHSLEVPDSAPSTPRGAPAEPSATAMATAMAGVSGMGEAPTANGSAAGAAAEPDGDAADAGMAKRDSRGRAGGATAAAGRLGRKAAGSASGSGLERLARTAARRDSGASVEGGGAAGTLGKRGSVEGGVAGKRASAPEAEGERGHGVELTDRPMDF